MTTPPRPREFTPELLARIQRAVQPGDVISTLTRRQLNRIVAIDDHQILVETDRSTKRGAGPRPVPAWMVQIAWDHLTKNGSLTNTHLLDVLNVKRSSFVCALLARFQDVEVVSERPLTLRHRRDRRT
jgi:hypothetical protein